MAPSVDRAPIHTDIHPMGLLQSQEEAIEELKLALLEVQDALVQMSANAVRLKLLLKQALKRQRQEKLRQEKQ
ncbi:hypothetical protein BCR37DRAFT_380464 [Protomyces lactucae-debilis]|uniref:Uncharacterized protein n=1 Tax=Protomyces lactucae-debilis TaxID=2754530 RepID=A0A1Y2FCE0_PROLT|nr:uncharacterized protein BCR37DRAFT_380464 [Protomyces lactucae-debilis]ORY81571.1 hypothetical protein BCR37DRAFT_380464 [Protomyces lactucae-debilis]